MAGRPTDKTPELIDLICERIATSCESLHQICKAEDMPGVRTVYTWLSEDVGFQHKYACAREIQADLMGGEIIDIADDSSQDTIKYEIAEGIEVEKENHEWVNRSKLRVDARKWLMSKLNPKKYGDKLDIDHNISDTRKSTAELFPDALDEAGKGE